jgi:hypothetical protein
MHHPRTRGERRAVREQYIRRRKFIATQIWDIPSYVRPPHEGEHWWSSVSHPMGAEEWKPFEWGRYAKWNMNCGDTMCHSAKYFSNARKRRNALHRSESQAEFRRRNKTVVC